MFDKYKMYIIEEKDASSGVALIDLPPTSCFKDQYGNILMKLAPGVGSVVTCGKAPPEWGVDECAYCVCLSDSPELGRGGLVRYSLQQVVVPLEARINIRSAK